MTTAELRAYLLEVDPGGLLPVYVEQGDYGWMSQDVLVFVDQLAYWESDEVDNLASDVVPCVKIGQDDRTPLRVMAPSRCQCGHVATMHQVHEGRCYVIDCHCDMMRILNLTPGDAP